MTRRFILTTATLAAFLATGAPLSGAIPSTRRAAATTGLHATTAPDQELIAIGDRLVAVRAFGSAEPGGSLAVAVFVQPEVLGGIQLWAGRKNAWGSQPSLAEAVAGTSGVLIADVAIPALLPPSARLWIGIDRPAARPLIGSVPLPAA